MSRSLAGTRAAISLVSREKGGQRKLRWPPRIKTSDFSLCSSVGENCSSWQHQLQLSLVLLSSVQRRPSPFSNCELQLTGQYIMERQISLSRKYIVFASPRFSSVFHSFDLYYSPGLPLQRPRSPQLLAVESSGR